MRSYVSVKAPKSYVRDFYNRMIKEKGVDFLFRGVYADVNFRLEHGDTVYYMHRACIVKKASEDRETYTVFNYDTRKTEKISFVDILDFAFWDEVGAKAVSDKLLNRLAMLLDMYGDACLDDWIAPVLPFLNIECPNCQGRGFIDVWDTILDLTVKHEIGQPIESYFEKRKKEIIKDIADLYCGHKVESVYKYNDIETVPCFHDLLPNLHIGDIFAGSWGYNMTIPHIFQIVAFSDSGKCAIMKQILYQPDPENPFSGTGKIKGLEASTIAYIRENAKKNGGFNPKNFIRKKIQVTSGIASPQYYIATSKTTLFKANDGDVIPYNLVD